MDCRRKRKEWERILSGNTDLLSFVYDVLIKTSLNAFRQRRFDFDRVGGIYSAERGILYERERSEKAGVVTG